MLEICPNCNSKIRPGAKFCEVCGKKILGMDGKKTLDEIEEEIRAKVEAEFIEKHEIEFRERREKELRKEKQKELKNSKKSVFDSDILLAIIGAIAISVCFILLMIIGGHLSFNNTINSRDIGGGHSYITNSGFPLKFLTISNTPKTYYSTVVYCDYVNLILDFTLYAVCLFIFLFGILLVWKKIKK